MKVLDLFAGLCGWSEPFRLRGHETFSVDFDKRFDVSLHMDIFDLTASDLPWKPDVILASPPCNCFSVASIGKHWTGGRRAYTPKTEAAKTSLRLLSHLVLLIDVLQPQFFVIENPRGLMRKVSTMQMFERRTVTYCQYGETRMKPTDLWGGFPPSLQLKPICKNGDPCHVAAPRGSRTGTQGMDSAESAKIPEALALAVCLACEADFEQGVAYGKAI